MPGSGNRTENEPEHGDARSGGRYFRRKTEKSKKWFLPPELLELQRRAKEDAAVYISAEKEIQVTVLSDEVLSAINTLVGLLPEAGRKEALEQFKQTAIEAFGDTSAPQQNEATAVRPTIWHNIPDSLTRPYSKEPLPDELLTEENVATAFRIRNAKQRKKPEAEKLDPADVYIAGRIIRAHTEKTKAATLG